MSRPKLEPTLACCPPPCSQRFLSPIPARTGRKEKLQLAPSFPLCSKSVPGTEHPQEPPAGPCPVMLVFGPRLHPGGKAGSHEPRGDWDGLVEHLVWSQGVGELAVGRGMEEGGKWLPDGAAWCCLVESAAATAPSSRDRDRWRMKSMSSRLGKDTCL